MTQLGAQGWRRTEARRCGGFANRGEIRDGFGEALATACRSERTEEVSERIRRPVPRGANGEGCAAGGVGEGHKRGNTDNKELM